MWIIFSFWQGILKIFLVYILTKSAGAVEYTDFFSVEEKDFPNDCPIYDTKQSDGKAPCNAGALGNAECLFIAIAPMFTLAWSSSTWKGPIYESNIIKLCTYFQQNCLK